MTSAPISFNFASAMDTHNENNAISKRVRGGGDDNDGFNQVNQKPTSIYVNPNLNSFKQNSEMSSADIMDDLITDMNVLSVNNSDKQRMAKAAFRDHKMKLDKEQQAKEKEEEKKGQAKLNALVKKEHAHILKMLVAACQKMGQTNIQVKPLKDSDIIYGLEWPDVKPSTMNENYITAMFLKFFIEERRSIQTISDVNKFVEALFSEDSRLNYAKQSNPKIKPKLQILDIKEIDPKLMVEADDIQQMTGMKFGE